MISKQYDVGKFVNDQKVTDSFKVTIWGAYAPLMALEDLEINKLYEEFKNETSRIAERTLSIMRNPKRGGLGKKGLCKQRRDARLAYINDPKKHKHKRNLLVI